MFDSMIYKNHSFLKRPMEMNIWRAPTDNDRVVKRLWYEAGYDKMTQRLMILLSKHWQMVP
mgnify:CR=1 FL=1